MLIQIYEYPKGDKMNIVNISLNYLQMHPKQELDTGS
jgi:hypothetical protein